jgi:integrase
MTCSGRARIGMTRRPISSARTPSRAASDKGTSPLPIRLGHRSAPPWTDDGFRASWRKLRIALERQGLVGPSLTLYGLRHTVAVILRESGADERTIADALGQKTIEGARSSWRIGLRHCASARLPRSPGGREALARTPVLRSLIVGWQFRRPCKTCGAGAGHPSAQVQ